jgi:hypothetical protein
MVLFCEAKLIVLHGMRTTGSMNGFAVYRSGHYRTKTIEAKPITTLSTSELAIRDIYSPDERQ